MEVLVFPMMNINLFPRTTKPLRVIEPYYIELIKIADAEKKPVALGFVDNMQYQTPIQVGQKIHFVRETAGFGFVQLVEKRGQDDFLVVIQGAGKVKLGPVVDNSSTYFVAQAELILENTKIVRESEIALKKLKQILAGWVRAHIVDPNQRELFLNAISTPEEIVGSFANYMVRDYDMQYHVLEQNDINEKIETLYRLLESRELTTI